MAKRIFFALFLSSAFASGLEAQGIVALKKEVQRFGDPTENVLDLIAEVRDNLWKEILLVPDPEDKKQEIARILASSRGDLQTGATSGASGSTSAVVSPLLPAIFGVAIENGAITRTVSGTTITLKANPAGLVCAAKPEAATAVALRDREACNRFWTRLGITSSFDTSRGEKKTELANLETLRSKFSELSVRYELLNRRNVTLDRVRDAAEPFQQKAQALLEKQQELAKAMEGATTRLESELMTLVDSAPWKGSTAEVRRKMVEEVVRKVVADTKLPAGVAANVRTVWRETLEAYDRLEERIAGALVVTADYSFQRPDIATEDLAGGIVPKGTRPPNLHVARVVFAKAVVPDLDVTGNVSVSLFDEKREGMSSALRDVRLGVEGKFKLRSLNGYGRPTLSFAGLYAYLHQSPLGLGITTFNGVNLTEKGHIGVFQTKLEFPAANNGVRIPLSLTVANRTELIKESDVRGQIGVSFNLDSLFASQ
jgi:hypothetical protein